MFITEEIFKANLSKEPKERYEQTKLANYLCSSYLEGLAPKLIKEFKKEYHFLSNFWFMEKPFIIHGCQFKTSEHFFMAMKNRNRDYRKAISEAKSGSEAKKLSYKLLGEDTELSLREDWEEIKLKVMLYILRYKFSEANPTLRQQLIDTGNAYLMEGNYWADVIWGVDLKTNRGSNYLGKLLMQVRHEITGTTPLYFQYPKEWLVGLFEDTSTVEESTKLEELENVNL